MAYLFTSESVSEGHPDKVADQISDALIDNFLALLPEQNLHCVLKNPSNNRAWLHRSQIRQSLIQEKALFIEIQRTEQGGEFRDTKRKDLLKALKQLTFLTKIALCNFNLMQVPEAVLEMPGLTELNLSDNVLLGLPPKIFDLQHLRILDLRHNFLTFIQSRIADLNRPHFYLNLQGNVLERQGSGAHWGLRELEAEFGAALVFAPTPNLVAEAQLFEDEDNDENVMNYNPKRRRLD